MNLIRRGAVVHGGTPPPPSTMNMPGGRHVPSYRQTLCARRALSAAGASASNDHSLWRGIEMTRPKGKQFNVGTLIVGLLVVGALAYAFMSLGNGASTETAATNGSDASRAHASALVQPGELDDYYMFASGGHSGQIYVYGIPSMRRLRTIPVFTPD